MLYDEVTIDVPWGKIAVVCCGHPSGKPIVMVHGIQDSAGTFFPLIDRLKLPSGFRLIIPDLPGHGKSDRFPVGRPLFFTDFISPIKMIIKHFKLTKFTYLGHSTGAQIGLMYNVIYPDEIERFVSLDSLAYLPVEADQYPDWFKYVFDTFYDPKNYAIFNSSSDTGPTYTYEKIMKTIINSRELTEEAGKAVIERCLIPAGNGLYRLSWDQRMKAFITPAFGEQYQSDLLGKISIPFLTVFASNSFQNRRGCRIKLIDAYVKNNPGYRIAIVEGDHDVHLNNPELVAQQIREFLLGGSGDKELSDRLLKEFYEVTDIELRQISKL